MKIPYDKFRARAAKRKREEEDVEPEAPEVRTSRSRVRAGISKGLSDEEIAAEIDELPMEVTRLRESILVEELERYTASTSVAFVNYAVFAAEKIAKLDSLVRDFYDESGKVKAAAASAAVSAVKAQIETYDRVMRTAVEYKLLVIGGKEGEEDDDLRGATGEELISAIKKKVENINALIGEEPGALPEVSPPPGVPADSFKIRPVKRKAVLPGSS